MPKVNNRTRRHASAARSKNDPGVAKKMKKMTSQERRRNFLSTMLLPGSATKMALRSNKNVAATVPDATPSLSMTALLGNLPEQDKFQHTFSGKQKLTKKEQRELLNREREQFSLVVGNAEFQKSPLEAMRQHVLNTVDAQQASEQQDWRLSKEAHFKHQKEKKGSGKKKRKNKK